MRVWFMTHGIRWLIGVEYGSVEFRRHMQCVLETRDFTSAAAINHSIRRAVGWVGLKTCRICVKSLVQRGIHTFHGMVGYCSKYQYDATADKPFTMFHEGLNDADFTRAREQFLQWGKPNKNRVELTPANLIDKATMFASVKLRGVNAPDFCKTVGTMLASGNYTLSSQWAKANSGLDADATELVWKAHTNLAAFTGEDLGRLIFRQPTYRYYREAPDVEALPIHEREDYYDCNSQQEEVAPATSQQHTGTSPTIYHTPPEPDVDIAGPSRTSSQPRHRVFDILAARHEHLQTNSHPLSPRPAAAIVNWCPACYNDAGACTCPSPDYAPTPSHQTPS